MGSFPFSLNKSDFKQIAWQAFLVAVGAVATYFLQTVIPSIQTDNMLVLAAMPIVVAVLQALVRYVSDTRVEEERRRLPLEEFKQLPPEHKRLEMNRLSELS